MKCAYCNKNLPKSYPAIKVTVGKSNRYVCTKEHEALFLEQKEHTDSIWKIINEILGHDVVNTLMLKEVNPVIEAVGAKRLHGYLRDNRVEIERSMSRKTFVNDFAKMRYLSAIIKHSINQYKAIAKPERILDIPMEENKVVKYKRPERKKSLAELLEEAGNDQS